MSCSQWIAVQVGAGALPAPLIESALGATLVAGRILPTAIFSPLFGGSALPLRLRVALGLGIAGIFAAAAGASTPSTELLPALGRELLLGVSLAFAVTLVFGAFAWIGGWVDAARGATAAELADPVTGSPASPLSAFALWLALAVSFAAGLHRVFFAAFAEHLARRPVGSPLAEGALASLPLTALDLLVELFSLAALLAAPILVALLVIDICAGVVQRLASPFEAFALGLGLRGLFGVGLFLVGLAGSFALLFGIAREKLGGLFTTW